MKLDRNSVVVSVCHGQFVYVSIACKHAEQARDIRNQILEKIEIKEQAELFE